ncbi:MAG TPA: helix-turn-helix domain-containing protein [Stellaceae bacterium]|nr:helix-turn-helix domain-containing protein [Stellaceae bacterium]
MMESIAKPDVRRYVSPRRRQQADETRRRITAAARRLLGRNGYDATTIAEIAGEAGVATQTVYAAFGSKQGILKALIDRAIFGLAYDRLVAEALAEERPADRLRGAARIACEIYRSERAELEFLRGAGVVAPEISAIDQDRERQRFETLAAMIDLLDAARALAPGLARAKAHDVLFALTARDLYRTLVVDRHWTPERYQDWLGDVLVTELLGPNGI